MTTLEKSRLRLIEATKDILNSFEGRKLVANLTDGYLREKSKSRFIEFNFIDELPINQLDLFRMLFGSTRYSNYADFALALIKNQKIKYVK